MKRREFVTLLGGAAAWPLAARAQHYAKVAKVGFLYPGPQQASVPRIATILRGLNAAGITRQSRSSWCRVLPIRTPPGSPRWPQS
jgi:hypothetical protein